MRLTFVRFDSCDWEAWYADGLLIAEGYVISALQVVCAIREAIIETDLGVLVACLKRQGELWGPVERIEHALVDAQTGKAPKALDDVKRAAR